MTVTLEAVHGRLVLFLVLHVLGGHVGMPLIVLTNFASRKIVRHPVFLNFCITWTCFSSSYLVLLYAGQIERLYPTFSLCLTQAAMIYAGAAMMGVSTFVFLLHLFLVLRGTLYPKPPLSWHTLRLVAIISVPYLAYIIVFTAAMVAGNRNSQLVHRSSFYCTINLAAVAHLGTGIAVAGLLFSLIPGTLIVVMLYRGRKIILKADKGSLNISLLIRTLVFILCGLIALSVCAVILTHSGTQVSNIIIACLPVIAVFVFGSQTELLHAWCLWRKEGKASEQAYGTSNRDLPLHVDA